MITKGAKFGLWMGIRRALIVCTNNTPRSISPDVPLTLSHFDSTGEAKAIRYIRTKSLTKEILPFCACQVHPRSISGSCARSFSFAAINLQGSFNLPQKRRH